MMNRSKRILGAAGVVAAAALFAAAHSRAGTVCISTIYAHITGRGDTIDRTTGNLTESGKSFAYIFKGSPRPSWVLLPYQDGTTWNGYPAIGLEVQPTGSPLPTTDDGTDKVNLTIAQFPISQDRYYGFAMKLGNFGSPNQEILVAQWWQGVPYSPPMSLHIIPGTNFLCEMQVRNNNTGGNPNAPAIHIPVGSCMPGDWQTFVVYTRPHYVGSPGTGEVTVWHNDMSKPVADWTGDVGYDPSVPVNTNGTPGQPQSPNLPASSWTMYFGPYGDHDTINRQTYFANIAVASTMQGANPNQ